MRKTSLCLFLALLCLLCACSGRREEPAAPAASPSTTASETAAPVPENAPVQTVAPPTTDVPAAATETAAPPATPVPEPQPIEAGSYIYTDENGTVWQLNLKPSGTFSLVNANAIYNGEGWCDNGDGTATTGAAADAVGVVDFVDAFGSSTWRIEGEHCEPVQ